MDYIGRHLALAGKAQYLPPGIEALIPGDRGIRQCTKEYMTVMRNPLIALAAYLALGDSAAIAAGCQPGNGVFTACFYSGTAFNTFLLERQDSQINFAWGLSGPYPGGPVFQFSARWQGYFNFNSGSYRFALSANRGARLYIDGQLVQDRWTTAPAVPTDFLQTLTAGIHLIQLEYYNGWDVAHAQLSWLANNGFREFYISPAGNDNNDGRTPATAWASPFKVVVSTFQAGDRILFEGGKTFNGLIYLDARDQGTPSNPIVVSSYGTGRATIQPGTLVGLLAHNTAGIEVSNLNFVGSRGNTQDGIQFYKDLPGNTRLSHIRIDNVEVSGFGSAGISIFSSPGNVGYDDIHVSNVSSHDNVMAGLWMGVHVALPSAGYSHRDLYIGNSTFYNNTGATNFLVDSGFGIFLAGTDGAVIERNVIYNNGEKTVSFAGPMGIMTMESNNLVIQSNEVHHTHSSGTDGGGTNSVMQYNYIHDNDGSGINLSQYYPVRIGFSNNVVRYNISQNDGRDSISWAGIIVAGPVKNLQIYGNTIYGSATSRGFYSALGITGQTSNLAIRNNAFITQGGTGSIEQVSIAGGQTNMALQGNAYWGGGMRLNLNWDSKNATTLADFRRISSQETFSGIPIGVDANPLLMAPGTGPSFNNTTLLSTLKAYTPLPGSPLIDQGFNLTAFGVQPGARDFLGTAIPQANAFDIGAIEVSPSR